MGSLKKQIQAALKLHSMKMHFYDIETRYKNDSIIFISQKSEIGYLGYTFVSSKFAEFGSQLGMYISCRFGQEMKNSLAIIRLIDNLNLSYKAGAKLPNCYFGFTSLYYQSRKFYLQGTVSFKEKDNIEGKCMEIAEKVNALYSSKVQNFISHSIDLIDDIIEYPDNYGYPMAYILAVCYLNNKTELIEYTIKKAKQKRMYDNSSRRIEEIKHKLESYFG